MKGAAFGIAPRVTADDFPTPEAVWQAKQDALAELAKVRGNRAHRRHPVVGDPRRPNARRRLTEAERDRRNNRRRMAAASRKANR